jgi:transcriptional regulator with XRE-family HTH domain
MGIQKNLSFILKLIKDERRETLAEFADELEISRSHLQELLKNNTSPRIDTVEHIARKLGVAPYELMSVSLEDAQLNVLEMLIHFTGALGSLTPEKRRAFSDLFLKMIQLWGSDHVE